MQDNALSQWLSPLMAFCLSFIIIATFAPILGIQGNRQIDFWLLWLGTMLILALPICYLEIALAKRSKTTALNALSSLTRDADASQKWRLVGWLAVGFIPFLVGGILANASVQLHHFSASDIQAQIVFSGLAIAAFALSFVSRKIIILITAFAVVASLVLAQTLGMALPAWQVTPVEFSEWGSATVLALVASGLGLGLYWQGSLVDVKQQSAATKTVLPIWIAQLLAVIAFGFFAANTTIPVSVFVISMLTASALLLQMAREQLAQRQINSAVQWALLLLAVGIWFIDMLHPIFNLLLLFWGLMVCFIYAIFAGWIMKISHLRKSMNFSHELFYNLWRIAVRIVLPVAIILAIVALIGQFI